MLCRQIEVAIMSLLNRVKAHNRQGMRPHFLTFCTKATFKGQVERSKQRWPFKRGQLYNKAEQKGNCTTIQFVVCLLLANYIIERLVVSKG